MCGIVGVWHRGHSLAVHSELEPMMQCLRHRGPDDHGVWTEAGAGLGSLRLSILDISHRGHQPMTTPDGRGVLSYNGEVYNFAELRDELQQAGAVFTSSGDTEVVLQALHTWGPEKALRRFNGMFALAYYDGRTQTMWLARDRLGIKPLYVAAAPGVVVFASEPQALLEHPAVLREPNPRWLGAHARLGPVDDRTVPFASIEPLPPGTWRRLTATGGDEGRYFSVVDEIDLDRMAAADPRQAPAEFSRAFASSVARHLASDAPLAALCSGGVDSSLVAAHAKALGADIHAYVADTGDAAGEADKAQRVADHIGIGLTRVAVGPADFLRLWPDAVASDGRPSFHPSVVPLLALARRAHNDGFKVLLTGEGSDEMFGGYWWQADRYRAARGWRRLLPRRRKGNETAGPAPDSRSSDPERLRAAIMEKLAPLPPADRAFHAACLLDLHRTLGALLSRHDRMGMAASVEMRVPFIENNLLDLALHLPRRAKLHRNVRKWVVIEAAQTLLPADIATAPKRAFPVPPTHLTGTERLLAGGMAAEVMGWSAAEVTAASQRARTDPQACFRLLGIEVWARIFFDGQPPDTVAETLAAAAGT